MKILKHKYILTTACLLWFTASFCQKLKYEVYLFGNKIGETTVERWDSAGLKCYSLRSNTDAKVLFVEKKSAMATDVLYDRGGNLFSSFFQNIKNEEKFLTKTISDNTKFIITKDGEKTVIPGPITFSSVMLYFFEPPDLQKVFSERLGQFFEMVRQADGSYLATLDGHSSRYTYKAGKLIELEIKNSLGSILMKRVQ